MTSIRQERIADLVQQELTNRFPTRTLVIILALNLVIALVAVHFYNWQRDQDRKAADHAETQMWQNKSFAGQIEGLKATVEFGPRIEALAQNQARQSAILDAIARRLEIEVPDE